MSSQADENQGFVLGVVFFVIALVISLVIGLSIHQVNKRHAAKPVAVAAVAGAADAASVVVENGVVKFYFASGKADLAAGAKEALAAVVAGVGHGKKIVIMVFMMPLAASRRMRNWPSNAPWPCVPICCKRVSPKT